MKNIEQKIKDIIAEDINNLGYDLVCVQKEQEAVQIFVERKDGAKIQIEDCLKINAAIRNKIDFISDEYAIEISSPGIDRPLVSIEDFEKYKGFLAFVEFEKNVDNNKRIKGIIDKVINNEITFIVKDKNIVASYDNILKAKLVLTDELIKKGL